jgi:membrane-bound metal-dependent hydrolase YbcI (DUF457 family)
MATVAHVAAGLVIGRVHASTTRSPLLGSLLLLPVLAVLPDLDVFVGRVLVAAAPALAHRGATHSLGAAVIVGMLVWLVLPRGGRHFPPLETAVAAAIACASNGLLDLLSAGGESVAVFWPILDALLWHLAAHSRCAIRVLARHRAWLSVPDTGDGGLPAGDRVGIVQKVVAGRGIPGTVLREMVVTVQAAPVERLAVASSSKR